MALLTDVADGFKFGGYIEWPQKSFAAPDSPLMIGVAGNEGLVQGSMINFVIVDNRVRFEVSLDAARRGGLKIGAPLLSVAMRVQE